MSRGLAPLRAPVAGLKLRYAIPLVLAAYACASDAGTATGFVLGSMVSSKPTEGGGTAVVLTHPERDVITCKQSPWGNACLVAGPNPWKPEQYVAGAGYKTLHRVSTAIDAQGNRWLVLEVTR